MMKCSVLSWMAKTMKGVLIFPVLLLLVSCFGEEKEDDIKKNTVLVYIAADNNLVSNANPNIYSMNSSIRNGMDDANLLVFVDRKGVQPVLIHIHDNMLDTLEVYNEMDSTDPAVLAEVVDYVRSNWKSESYGLVLWSHGTGWLPTSRLHYVAPNMNYARAVHPSSDTKAFAWENKSNKSYVCMELEGLVEALPTGLFDFIVFDACYMANVEVVYALRKKARYIISSCYEIVSFGFPYHIVTRDFLNGNLMKACREFYAYYNKMSGWEQMAGVSLVKTEGLDSLASCFKKIVAGKEELISDMDVSEIQCFDRFRNHVFYDLEDFAGKLGLTKDEFTEFKLQLEKCVPYRMSTPYIFPGEYDSIKVNNYCGLSVYIPIRKYDSPGLNDDYRETSWSKATGYGKEVEN